MEIILFGAGGLFLLVWWVCSILSYVWNRETESNLEKAEAELKAAQAARQADAEVIRVLKQDNARLASLPPQAWPRGDAERA